jgi:hypothetical protein
MFAGGATSPVCIAGGATSPVCIAGGATSVPKPGFAITPCSFASDSLDKNGVGARMAAISVKRVRQAVFPDCGCGVALYVFRPDHVHIIARREDGVASRIGVPYLDILGMTVFQQFLQVETRPVFRQGYIHIVI